MRAKLRHRATEIPLPQPHHFDKQGRAKRWFPTPYIKVVNPATMEAELQLDPPPRITPLDIRWFARLQRLPHLPLSYSSALECRSYDSMQARATKLVRHGYLKARPSLDRCSVHSLLRPAEVELAKSSDYRPIIKTGESEPHQFGVSILTASFELGAREHGLTFIDDQAILNHKACPPETRRAPNPFEIPITFSFRFGKKREQLKTNIEHDGRPFGLAFEKGGKTTYKFFHLEFDRDTEELRSQHADRINISRKMQAVLALAQKGGYSDHYGIPNSTILWATINRPRMYAMMDVLDELTEGKGSPIDQAFTTIPDLMTMEPFLPPRGWVFDQDRWVQVKNGNIEPYDILAELGVIKS